MGTVLLGFRKKLRRDRGGPLMRGCPAKCPLDGKVCDFGHKGDVHSHEDEVRRVFVLHEWYSEANHGWATDKGEGN